MPDSVLRVYMAVYLLIELAHSLHAAEVPHARPHEPELAVHHDGGISFDLRRDPEEPPRVIALMSGVAMGMSTCYGNLVAA